MEWMRVAAISALLSASLGALNIYALEQYHCRQSQQSKYAPTAAETPKTIPPQRVLYATTWNSVPNAPPSIFRCGDQTPEQYVWLNMRDNMYHVALTKEQLFEDWRGLDPSLTDEQMERDFQTFYVEPMKRNGIPTCY
jgi:hypothetical protein